jgi:hypothetical protein
LGDAFAVQSQFVVVGGDAEGSPGTEAGVSVPFPIFGNRTNFAWREEIPNPWTLRTWADFYRLLDYQAEVAPGLFRLRTSGAGFAYVLVRGSVATISPNPN